MSIAEKLTTIAKNEQRVYNAGYAAARAITPETSKTVSGEIISVDDVSKVTHDIECKISGVDDPTSVTVVRTGANLLPQTNPEWVGVYNAYYDPPLPPGTYTLSAVAATAATTGVMVVRMWNAKGGEVVSVGLKRGTTARQTMQLEAGAKVVRLSIYAGSNVPASEGLAASLTDAILNLGTEELPCEPYKYQILTPNADGAVEGMTSVSPYMNVFTNTDGAVLDVTYHTPTETERFYTSFEQGNIDASMGFAWCPLDKASTTSVISALSDTATAQTLTLSLSAVNTAFETSEGAADGSTSEEWLALAETKPNWLIELE